MSSVTGSRPGARRLIVVAAFSCAAGAGLFLWQTCPDLYVPVAQGPAADPVQSGEGGQRQAAERAGAINGLASSSPSAIPDGANPEAMSQRRYGSAGPLELEPPSLISLDPDCLKGETQQSGSAAPDNTVITAQEMVSQATAKLEANQEFPRQAHVVRWEMAFGLPGPGVLFWAEWSGENPARYSIHVQDARTPQSEWDAAGKASIQLRAKDLSWTEAVEVLKEIKHPLVDVFGPASYRRLIVTGAVPVDPGDAKGDGEKSAGLSAEVLGPRILFFSRAGLSCERTENSKMHCSCGQPHVHR